MAEHTKTPWVFGWGDGLTGPTTRNALGATVSGPDRSAFPVSVGTETIALCPDQRETSMFGDRSILLESGKANARRIVAAVNATSSLSTASLEEGVVGEMIEALRKAQPVTSAMAAADNAPEFQEAADAIDALLAKIGGEK